MDYTVLERREKYGYLIKVLNDVKTCSLFKNEEIEGNSDLMTRRNDDIKYMNRIINDELKKDNIKKMTIQGTILNYDPELESF